MTTPNKKRSRDFTAIYFLVGIPVWVIIALSLDSLTRIMEGMTGAQPTKLLTTMPSHLIIAYFVFSFVVAITVTDRTFRLWFAILIHLPLVASMIAAVQPDFSGAKPGDIGRSSHRVLLLCCCLFAVDSSLGEICD
jgi:L-asparagine transporter-like permease